MKKILLLLFIMAASNQLFAFTTQGHWRWQNDNGTEATATNLADTNTAPTINSSDNIRLRIEVYNPNTDEIDISNTTLAYSTTGADGSWVDISDVAGTNDFVLVKSPYLTDLSPTTQQLPARPGYTFQPGKVLESQTPFTYMLPPAASTEFVWVLKPTENVKLNTTYFFESSVVDYDLPLPSLKVGGTLAIPSNNISIQQEADKAVIRWNASVEDGVDRFEVLRSSNAQTWQTVASVPAKTTQSNYQVVDNNPINGNSFYRIEEYAKDGTSVSSEIKSFTFELHKVIASVFPNPTVSDVNFKLQNYAGNVTATLVNIQGTVVHQQKLMVESGAPQKLSIRSKLPSGTYFLNLTGTNLSQKIKLIVQ